MHRTPRLALAAALLLGSTAATATRADERTPQVPQLEVEKYTLDNGLEVLLHEDHTTPVVGVNLWYKVGSQDEKAGKTGFAHLFEHLMFQGSQHHDDEYFGPMEKLGAQINGSTSEDRTNYYEVVPSNALETALWLESDRMGFLLPALTQAKLDEQRKVVKQERGQRVDNQPYGQAEEAILRALYPEGHPYHHSVIGSLADLSAASLGDVADFFRRYYAPNNASLCIAGDFDPATARALVRKYFGAFPRGPAVKRPGPITPKLDAPKHLKQTDAVKLPRVQLVWPTVPTGDPDEPALDVLATVLGGQAKENRLYLALVYNQPLAATVGAAHPTARLSGTFEVSITGRPTSALEELVKVTESEVARLQADGPTEAEVLKAQNGRESQLVVGLQSMMRTADFLNQNNVTFGDPLAYKAEMTRLFAVTPADVKRVARKYLTADRVRLDITPGPPTPRAPELAEDAPHESVENTKVDIKDDFDRGAEPRPGPTPKFAPPAVVRRTLSNGLELLVAERHELPIVTVNLVVKGGETLVPAGKEGLGSMTAALLTEGTRTRDALELAGELAEIGASVDAEGGREASTLSLTTLTKHTAKALDLYADVLLNPTFPEKALERLRDRRLASLLARSSSPAGIAGVVFPRLLYGEEHPYGRPDLGTPKSVKGLTRGDARAFYERLYHPNNAAMIVVGDVTPDAAVAALEGALKGWKPGEPTGAMLPEPPPAAKGVTVYLVDKPAAAQSILAVGQVGQPRSSPDYFPLTVMNAILGGQFSSRINLNLREQHGYTYGANSHFVFRQGPGPFQAGGAVKTEVTKEAVVELIKELTDITGPRPATAAELAFAKDRLIKGFPGRFETTSGVSGALVELVLYHLPEGYFAKYQSEIEAVTRADVDRVAREHLDPSRMVILIVGDRSKVEPSLKGLPFARVVNVLDPDGNPLPGVATTGGGAP